MTEYGMDGIAEKHLEVQHGSRVCTMTMNRPEVMNALSDSMIDGMIQAMERVALDDAIRVLILEGAGNNFCSGADMNMLHKGLSAPDWLPVMRKLGRLIKTIREIPQPVVAKVRGVAVGGGANLALSADFVVAAHPARFAQLFVNIGVGLDAGGTYLLPRLAGIVKARELALLGEMISGEQAASIGLIYRSVPEDELDREVESLVSKLSEKSLKAMAAIKGALERSLGMSLDDVLNLEATQQAILFQSNEHREAVRAFLESRGKIRKAR